MTLLWASLAFAQANFVPEETTLIMRLNSLVGVFGIIGLAWLLSENRKAINWKPVLIGVGIQAAIGVVLMNDWVAEKFVWLIDVGVNKLLSFADQGSIFLFKSFGTGAIEGPLMNMAFWVLPKIIFFAALMAGLYHLGIMQFVVQLIARVMVKTLGTSGAESLSAAGNIFVGQTEAPLLVRPFIQDMTRSELMAIMTGGFATIAGSVLGAYVSFLQGVPNIAGNLVMASMMAAPAALALAKVVVPETEVPQTAGSIQKMPKSEAGNVVEAVAGGASDGMKLALNVAAMLIAIVALVAMVDWMMGVVPLRYCNDALTFGYGGSCSGDVVAFGLTDVFAGVFTPIALLMGVPWEQAGTVGTLLGQKIVLTEFIAYENLGAIINGGQAILSERSAIMATFALCGFANFASIGIQLGGIGGMAPDRMSELASLGMRAMTTGALATCLSGAMVGVIY